MIMKLMKIIMKYEIMKNNNNENNENNNEK